MPVLDSQNVVFVHIPKTGGTAVDVALQRLGPLRLLEKSGNHESWTRYGHSPQHCTYRELEELGELYAARAASQGCIFSIVRHPYERVVSAYKMRRRSGEANNLSFAEFLDQFLRRDPQSIRRFDAHQLPCMDYLQNQLGKLPDDLHILVYQQKGQLAAVAELLFSDQAELKRRFLNGTEFHQPGANDMSVAQLTPVQRQRIARFYAADAIWFPDVRQIVDLSRSPRKSIGRRRPQKIARQAALRSRGTESRQQRVVISRRQ